MALAPADAEPREPRRIARLAAYLLHSTEDFGTTEQAAVAAFPGPEPRRQTAGQQRDKILDTDGPRKRPSEARTPEHLRRLRPHHLSTLQPLAASTDTNLSR